MLTETRTLASGWYYYKQGPPAGLQSGPFSWEQIYGLAQQGTIGPRDLVWNAGLADWCPAAQVPGLMPSPLLPGQARPGMERRPPSGYGREAPPNPPTPSQQGISVLAWLIPLIAIVVVGAGLGVYFGLLRDRNSGGENVVETSSAPVVVIAEDGARVTFPPFSGAPAGGATLTQVSTPTGEVAEDALVVSGEYALRVNDSSAITGEVMVALPLRADLLPSDWDPAGLIPEALNPSSGRWEAVGQVVGYDEATQQVSFDVPYAAYATASQATAVGGVSLTPIAQVAGGYLLGRGALIALAAQPAESRYRIRLHFMSNWVTYVPAGDHTFEVTYYPISGVSYSMRKDADWPPSNSWATLSKVPDYVEDLHHALEVGYAGLLGIEKYGGRLFAPLGKTQEVVVTNTGAVEGATSLFWGSVKISNSRIASYEQLEQVATHELTHLLCDRYYNSASAAANRWFFEATAEYFAARARGLSEAQRGSHYASPSVVTDVYLSVPLTASNVSSYYAAAHLLDWCSKRYGQTLVPTAIEYGSLHPVDRDDVAHFSHALELHGESGGIGAAYGAYVRALMTTPQDYGGANATFKSNITTYAVNQKHVSGTVFDEYTTYIKLSRVLPPLSSTGVFLQGRNSDDALLVIDSSGSNGDELQATTYDTVSGSNAFYQSTPALDAGLGFPYPQSLSVAHFSRLETKRQLEQLIANTSTTQAAQVEVAYYLLRPPPVTLVEDGAVTWSTGKLGNIPRELIQGYHVYKDGVRLTSSPVSVPADGYSELRFRNDQIKAGDTIVVQVVDRSGNAWPRVSGPQQPETTATSELTTTTDTGTTEVASTTDTTGGTTTVPAPSVLGTWRATVELQYYVRFDKYYYEVRTLVMSADETCTWEVSPVLVDGANVGSQSFSINTSSSPPEYEYYTGTYRVGGAVFSDGTIWLDDGYSTPETFGVSEDGQELYFQSTVLKR